MGLFDDVKQKAAMAKVVLDANEHWARIVAIEGKTGPFARIRLEIHREGRAPYQYVASSVVPRDVQPKVGMDVAIANHTGPNSSTESWAIKWHKPPHYGYDIDMKPMSQDIVAGVMHAQEQVAQAWVGNPAAAPPPAPDPAERAARLARLREQGAITQAEYDQAMTQVPAAEPAAPAPPLPLIGPTTAATAELFAPAALPPSAPLPPVAPAAPAAGDDAERLLRLVQLRAQGVISADEYDQAAAQLKRPAAD